MEQEDFWSNNPCGSDGSFKDAKEQRYRMEPWLPRELRKIEPGLGSYLEIGCGQGVDCYYICSQLNSTDSYTAIDYSVASIEKAINNKDMALHQFSMNTTPQILQGDAMALEFKDDSIDFIYSMGVLHHTPSPQKCVDEIHRVLKTGGKAKIFLYKKPSFKVGVAKFLRGIQKILDTITLQDRIFYKILKGKRSKFFGTMVLECFGVPWMGWYNIQELEQMFVSFAKKKFTPYGYNFPRMSNAELDGYNRFGYFYMIEVEK